MVKLVVHIGHGKTGSSSIQASLLHAREHLKAQGIKYLGLMLEYADNSDRPIWQVRSGSDQFFDQTPAAQANLEIGRVLKEELNRLQDENIKTAIWSNEWLISRASHTIEAIDAIRKAGFQVEIQCYVRRHDKWAQSAYSQWGLKHKSYTGPIRDFSNWLSVWGDRDFLFAPPLKIWDREFGTDLKVFNFDSAGDVVQHFMRVNDLVSIASIDENISAAPALSAAQSVYNSRKMDPVLPTAFDVIVKFSEKGDENRVQLPTLDRLMPSNEALANLVRDRAGDISEINALLERCGEPPLSFESPPKPTQHPTPWEMDQFILKLLYSMSEEARVMRKQIAALRLEVAAMKNDGPR